jgi:uncharacterized protein YqeY
MAVTFKQVTDDQKQALKDRNMVKRTLLTTLLGEAKMRADKAAEKEPRDANGAVIKRDPTPQEMELTIDKFLKDLRDNLVIITDEQKIAANKAEQAILMDYKPQQLTEEQLTEIFKAEFPEGIKQDQFGRAMAILKANYAGQYNGTTASNVLKKLIK